MAWSLDTHTTRDMACYATANNISGVGAGSGARMDAAGVRGASKLVGLELKMECRVGCTVELLWDVDLPVLGAELNVDPKL